MKYKLSTFFIVQCLVTTTVLALVCIFELSCGTPTKQDIKVVWPLGLKERLLTSTLTRKTNSELSATGQGTNVFERTLSQPKSLLLVFSNPNPSSLNYVVDISQDLRNWSVFTNGVALVGWTTNNIPSSSWGFFRVYFHL